MCNDYERIVEWKAFQRALEAARLQPALSLRARDLPCADDIRVGDIAPVLLASGNGVKLSPMNWGFSSPKPKAPPVFNFRAENGDFTESRRCLVPASAFLEFTGSRVPKSKWRFALPDGEVFAIAGIWRATEDDGQNSFTMLTMPPGATVAPFHDRQVMTLQPVEWSNWLYLDSDVGPFTEPPAAPLEVTLARAGRDTPPEELLKLIGQGGKPAA